MNVFFSSGGTGGHIYPALALAEELERQRPEVSISFIGSQRGLEKKILAKTTYPFYRLPMLPFQGSFLYKLLTVFLLPWSCGKALWILLKAKPQAIIGTGGYASVPMILVGSLMRVPCFLWEANAYPGLANRVLSRFVRGCFVVFEDSKQFLKNKNVKCYGFPLRKELEKGGSLKAFKNQFYVLVLGGSQGASVMNKVVSELFKEPMENVFVLHQTGLKDFKVYKDFYKDKVWVEPKSFLYDISGFYKKADMVISRAGSGALSELAALSKPALLIPLPHLANDHQLKNAEALSEQGAVRLLPQKNLNPESLKNEIELFKRNKSLRDQMAIKIKQNYKQKAGEKIIKEILLDL